ncbi:unnamed protein product [Laminaria digitata]
MQARRAKVEKIMSSGGRLLEGDMDEVHDVTLAVKHGEVPLRIYVPSRSASRSSRTYNGVILWMHGGGWMFGSVESHETISRDLAEASGMILVSVGYRLSPEVKFPVPMQDCLAAVQWVKRNIWAFGGDRTRMAFVGESSGGNLAIATALQMGRSWFPLATRKSELCALVAASPPLSYAHAKQGLDGGDGGWRSYKRYWTGYGLEGAQMKGYWDNYLRKKSDGLRPLASPIRAPKRMLRGLPPTLLLRAEHEILWDEISQMGRNLANAGQKVEEIQSQGCMHGVFAKGAGSCGMESLRNAADFIKKHCA